MSCFNLNLNTNKTILFASSLESRGGSTSTSMSSVKLDARLSTLHSRLVPGCSFVRLAFGWRVGTWDGTTVLSIMLTQYKSLVCHYVICHIVICHHIRYVHTSIRRTDVLPRTVQCRRIYPIPSPLSRTRRFRNFLLYFVLESNKHWYTPVMYA